MSWQGGVGEGPSTGKYHELPFLALFLTCVRHGFDPLSHLLDPLKEVLGESPLSDLPVALAGMDRTRKGVFPAPQCIIWAITSCMYHNDTMRNGFVLFSFPACGKLSVQDETAT